MRHPTDGPRPRRARSTFIAGGGASLLACPALAATVAPPASALQGGCVQAALTVTCTPADGVNEFGVPKGLSSIHVVAVSGAGGSAVSANSGLGARASGDFAVSQGQSLLDQLGTDGDRGDPVGHGTVSTWDARAEPPTLGGS
jgi:streptogramin lyase